MPNNTYVKYLAVIIAVILLLSIIISKPVVPIDGAEEMTRLKISAYLLDKSVASPSDEYAPDMPFALEELEPGVTRFIAPADLTDMYNINILFEYDSPNSMINVSTDDMQMSIGESKTQFYMSDDGNDSRRMFGYDFNIPQHGYIAFLPVGGGMWGYRDFDKNFPPFGPYTYTEIGHEYFITVRAYRDASDEYPVSEAKLKLVKLKDDTGTNSGTDRSMFYSIELIT